MEDWQLRGLQTLFALIIYIVIRTFFRKLIDRFGNQFQYNKPRIKVIKKLVTAILFFILFSNILFIWGVNSSDLLYFISSLLAVIGIALFAQWSMLSNITSTLIIFFNHPVKIGDTITIMDKEQPVEGKITDIGVFFMTLKTNRNEVITIPSNLFIQKVVKRHSDNEYHSN